MRATALFLVLGLLAATLSGCEAQKVREASSRSVAANTGAASNETVTLPDTDGSATERKTESGPTSSPRPEPTPSAGGPTTSGKSADKHAKSGKKTAGGKEAVMSVPEDATSPAKPAPGVAEAVVGREASVAKAAVKQDRLQAGLLTAGSFDDNINPHVFNSFVKKMSQNQGLGDLTTKLNGQRVLVIVKDGAGKPVGNARVKLSAGAAASSEIVTRSDGRAVFILSLDQLPADQALLANVTGPNGGNPVTDTIAVGSNRWEITLPGVQAQLPKNLDLAIVLDTTGSMQDEIDHLKAEIRSISAAIARKFPEVNQRFALILYRDEGDEYVVRPFDFTTSLDTFHKNIAAQSAAGGGDYPEAMHKGLQEATQLRWQDKDTARVAFLIADAPPHAQHMNATLAAVNALRKRGVAVYPVACSGYDDACEFVMRSSAMLTGSQFLFLTDDSGVGNAHGEPRIPYYQVERLEKLMIRMIDSELAGQQVRANPAEIIRTVGKKVN
jgi:hypothetical protein